MGVNTQSLSQVSNTALHVLYIVFPTVHAYPVLWIAYTACNIMTPHVVQSLTILRIHA